jgi:acetoin utilization protein AcuC
MARILIVDGDSHFVRMARHTLQGQGYEVSAAQDTTGALTLMERTTPDLVFLGGSLGEGQGGMDLRERLSRSTRPQGIPVVLLSSVPDPPPDAHQRLGETAWLTKPLEPQALVEAAGEYITRTAFVYSPEYAEYDYGSDHPLEPRRAREAAELCHKYGLLEKPWIDIVKPQPASVEDMATFHDREYLTVLKEANDGLFRERMIEFGLGTVDCPVFRGVYDYSALVAGGTLLAAELVSERDYDLAFNLAGGFHHAQRRNAEGFCYVNDIVIAILRLLSEGHRIAYVDLDAHHGDGVQSAFYGDNRVLTISLHETGKTLFPWSGFETEIGSGDGAGYNINLPLPPQTDDEIFLLAFNAVVPSAVAAFDPDIVFALIGADGLLADPLSHLSLTNNSYAEAVKVIEAISPKCVALGGGGYQMTSVTRAWCLAWAVMNGIEPQDEYAGTIGGMMLGTEYVEGGGLRDRHAYTTGPLKVEIRKEVLRVTEYIKETVLPLINPGP